VIDHEYKALLSRILEEGETRTDRTGVGTVSLFGAHIKHDMRGSFPLLTLKKVNFDWVVRELLWFLSGSTNVNDLGPAQSLWRPWARPDGELGPIYGEQWRLAGGSRVDQISQVIESIKTNPWSRRHVVSAWNVGALPYMALAPCHAMFQFYVGGEQGEPKYLDLSLYQRSADLCVGVPFNVASYALLLSMVANECGLTPRRFFHNFGDAHIYLNHLEGVKTLLARTENPLKPALRLPPGKPVLDTQLADIGIENYSPNPRIHFEVAV
jgi:thymidylate synthase